MKSILSEALCAIRGLLNQLFINLEGEQGEEWLQEFKKFLRKETCWSTVTIKTARVAKNKFPKLISKVENLSVDAVDGKETLYEAKDIFSYRDPDFENYGANRKGLATPETKVSVYEMVKDGNFVQLFRSLSSDLRKLCLTQAQIKNFAMKHKNLLRTDGYATFFLFEANNEFFVATVNFPDDGRLGVYVYRLEDFHVWFAEFRPRLVVPQLDA